METSAPKRRRIDGHDLRRERTKQRIIEAYLDLLSKNPQIPTAAQIAKGAGCSARSVFERFTDLPTLSFAAADYVFAQGVAQAVAHNVDADRQTRLRSQVKTRAQICEQWLPLWRVLIRDQSESKLLKMRIERMRDLIGERLQLMYEPELSTLSEPERRQLLIALEALTDFEAWGQMREHHGLSFEAACDVWINVINRLLPSTPPAHAAAQPISCESVHHF